MVFFGGFQLFQVALSNLTQQNDFKVIFVICIIAFTFFNSFYLLINLIADFAELGLFISKESFKTPKLFFGKSLVFCINAVLLFIMMVFGCFYFFDILDISKYFSIIPYIHGSVY